MEVFVTAAKRYQTDAVHPFDRVGDLETTVRSKLVEDVTKALLTTHTRGEYARNTFLANEGPIIEPQVEGLEGWVSHEFRFIVQYEYDESSP